jgi:hypothetical protein
LSNEIPIVNTIVIFNAPIVKGSILAIAVCVEFGPLPPDSYRDVVVRRDIYIVPPSEGFREVLILLK